MSPDLYVIYILIQRNMVVILTYVVEEVLFLKQREQLLHKIKTHKHILI